jgi:hypothetical protein
MVWLFQKKNVWTLGVSLFVEERGKFRKILSHHLKLSTEEGRQFQGVGAVDAAMVVVVPNCLLWPKRGWSQRIPP